ncbi:MAG: SIS domain-containing protein [Anaerolineae bacterium]|jgi:glucosamine--fructose-6-phosphate aminotransferase (isomerizing)
MSEDIYDQLLRIPFTQLVDLTLAGLERQGEMLKKVIESVQSQLRNVVGEASPERIYLAGCGDSYFAALSARYAFEQLTGLPTIALEAMELAHYTLLLPNSLAVVISSSGEVSMTLEAGKIARQAGVNVVGVTAQEEGRMAHELLCLTTTPDLSGRDYVDQIGLILGNFSFSLAALYLLAIYIGQKRGHLDAKRVMELQVEIKGIPKLVEEAIGCSARISEYLESVSDEADFYFLGAGPSYGVALFYQAKFFEQARRPVYGVELEEFPHEQFFLLRPGVDAQVWFIVPSGSSQERVLEIMTGCQEMGARAITVVTSHDDQIRKKADLAWPIDVTSEMFSPLVSVVPGELLGIYAFGRWGSSSSFASNRGRQMAISERLTRQGRGKV